MATSPTSTARTAPSPGSASTAAQEVIGASSYVERNALLETFAEIVDADAAEEFRVGKITVALADQVLQLIGQHPAQLDMQAGQIAGEDGHTFVTREWQQRTLAGNRELGRKRRYQQQVLVASGQQVATEGFQPLIDLNVHIAADGRVMTESVAFAVLALTGDQLKRQTTGFGQHGAGDFIRVAPVPGLRAFLQAFRLACGPAAARP